MNIKNDYEERLSNLENLVNTECKLKDLESTILNAYTNNTNEVIVSVFPLRVEIQEDRDSATTYYFNYEHKEILKDRNEEKVVFTGFYVK